MRVIRAEVLGMCFGVRDALKAIAKVENPEGTTIHGELVHNPVVLVDLEERGFSSTAEDRRDAIPSTPNVLITAHGISDRERKRLESAGKTLIDTTCPLVVRVHQAAKQLADDGYHVVLIGKPGHVEVRGITEDLESFTVVSSPEDVASYPHSRIGIISQSTTPESLAKAVRDAVFDRNPQADIRWVDTICLPTKEHQRALERLLDQVSAVVVVGGRNSNNTRELVRRCRERGASAWHVESADDLDDSWFDGISTVGLTAGTSTLDATIDAVHDALSRIGKPRVLVAAGR
ncbi:MAG: 4-hydroxy-3-methylbut-2-enyl diphosphate reductase [Isosphaeraceae bacterium]|nr:4-hydroxy-3-methylbut-2-enyl diphosphate reductase [Isosphaeraceae bacterium]